MDPDVRRKVAATNGGCGNAPGAKQLTRRLGCFVFSASADRATLHPGITQVDLQEQACESVVTLI